MKLTGKPSIDKPWLQYYPEESINEEIPYENIYTALVRENKNFNSTLRRKLLTYMYDIY